MNLDLEYKFEQNTHNFKFKHKIFHLVYLKLSAATLKVIY